MTDEATTQRDIIHDITSLPSSPQPKRTRYTEATATLFVAAMQDNRTLNGTDAEGPRFDKLFEVVQNDTERVSRL
ncbi:hypothetical protein LTR12_015729 [Friedmanniomyces endolithicus]|nr:hypothetical protein LTR12_015729 [Friedmanniomyces endolithicus]